MNADNTEAIKYFRADSTFVPHEPYIPGAEAGQIWLALHKIDKSAWDPCAPELVDPLTKNERALYNALTAKFAFDASISGYEYTESKPSDQ